ncbi:hypothetical protein MGN70_012580 [Eutypa lata]|nr:hypothetical protein MGN70_012580 [Eutypa lata]
MMLFSRVSADVSFEGSIPTNVAMGTSYTIQWETDADSVRVTLVSGSESSNNIYHLYDVICDIWIVNDLSQACNSTDTSVDWTPVDDLPVGHYMLMANGADDSTAYSNQFNLAEAGSDSSSESSSESTETSTATTGSTATSTSTPTSGDGSTTSASTSVPGSSETSSAPDDTTSGGLSTGAKAGIGIGAAVGGLALLGGLGFLVFRMGKRAADEKKANDEPAEAGDSKPEESQPGSANPAADQAEKAEGGGIAELQAPNKIHEAPDYKTRLDTPDKPEFVSELDATGGLFVVPQASRPNTGDTGASQNKENDKENAAPSGEEGGEGGAAKEEGEAAASESNDKASTSSGKPKSVIYETPDDIGRPEDK